MQCTSGPYRLHLTTLSGLILKHNGPSYSSCKTWCNLFPAQFHGNLFTGQVEKKYCYFKIIFRSVRHFWSKLLLFPLKCHANRVVSDFSVKLQKPCRYLRQKQGFCSRFSRFKFGLNSIFKNQLTNI